MSNCKQEEANIPTVLRRLKHTVGIFASYCFTANGHYILLQSRLFQYFLAWYYVVPTLV